MDLPSVLNVTPIYVAIFGLLFFPFTFYVGLGRLKTNILIGDGGNDEMVRRIRAQANFMETVPMALFLLIMIKNSGFHLSKKQLRQQEVSLHFMPVHGVHRHI